MWPGRCSPNEPVTVPFTGQIRRPLPLRIGPAGRRPGSCGCRPARAPSRPGPPRTPGASRARWRARSRRPLRSRAQLALRGGQAVARGGDVVAPAQDRLGRGLLAVLELGQQSLGLLGARLEHLHARHDRAVLVGDPLQELGALEQVGEAVGLEHHRERVGLVGLVELHQPVGQRRAALLQLRAGPRQAVARDLEVVAHGQQLVAGAVELGLDRAQPALGAADLALEAADAVVVALDVLREDALLALLALDLGALLLDALDSEAPCPGRGSKT